MDLDSLSLQQLLARTALGDHACFAQVYARTRAHLFGVALRISRSEQAAEDVLQEAFVSIWKSAGSYRSEVNGQVVQPMTWLIAVVRNKALDALRQRKARPEAELPEAETLAQQGLSAEAPSALDLLTHATQALQIEACIGALEGNHRQSLALAYYQGLSHAEVAQQMGAPLGTVKAWIRRGLDKLKTCLAARDAA